MPTDLRPEDVKSESKIKRPQDVDPECYASAPPLTTPPRQYRFVEQHRKREELSPWKKEPRAPEAGSSQAAADVKPDIRMMAAPRPSSPHILHNSPPASPSSSSRRSSTPARDSPEPPEDNKIQWGTPALRRPTMLAAPNPRRLTSAAPVAPPPPHLYHPTAVGSRPTPSSVDSTLLRVPRNERETRNQFDYAVESLQRLSGVRAVVVVTNDTSSSNNSSYSINDEVEEVLNLSSLSEMSIGDWDAQQEEEEDFYDLNQNWSAETEIAGAAAAAAPTRSGRSTSPRHSWRQLNEEPECAFGERLTPTATQVRARGQTLLHRMAAPQGVRVANVRVAARSPPPRHPGTGSARTGRRPTPSSADGRRPSTLREMTERQQRRRGRSATVTEPSYRESFGDGRVPIIVIPPGERSLADNAARIAPRPFRTTSGGRRTSETESPGSGRQPSSNSAAQARSLSVAQARSTRTSSRSRQDADDGQQSEESSRSSISRAAAAGSNSRGRTRRL